ncbi:HNH endonuclease [Brevibacillus aydinogluensis]|uniref:HNH endonuclease n=1 Tax=Brevibacillus aydinogluensis TaxID=927786 RepID=A0AA48M4A5_9BACL|nr:HNH endonuclease [Brevibacillus aydinogluensis]CAJ1001015.1 HNH endonuclease [Brevibacillus aydinogluensis]
MNNVILQPAANGDAKQHYIDTIVNPVELSRIARYLEDEHVQKLKEIYPDQAIPTWGVTPGTTNGNIPKWNRIQTGDITLFSGNGGIFSSAITTYKVRSKELALDLWGTDPKGQTWEYVYFLDEVKQQRISYLDFNRVVGYKDNFIIQGFSILDQEKSIRVIEAFDLQSDTHFPEIPFEEYEKAIKDFDPNKPLDAQGKVMIRTEQSFLRKVLFGNKKIATCGICGHEYPTSFLVAAHIKKRSKCTPEEKLDFRNIVMPMCKFGCDDLYEKGYITVFEGKIITNNKKIVSPSLKNYLDQLKGKECSFWNENRMKYFEWHYNYHLFE